MFSGGVGSWAAAKRVVERHGTDDLTLLFCDTRMEDEDLYRFLYEAACNVFGVRSLSMALEVAQSTVAAEAARGDGSELLLFASPWQRGRGLVWLSEGRTPWDVYRDERILTQRFDPCSKLLKRERADTWIAQRFTPDDCIRYVGIDWTEEHRLTRLRERLAPWRVEGPLCNAPYVTKDDCLAWLRREGIEPPRLYGMGFSHNNCGGFCIKAGQGHFARLLRAMPERYAYHEQKERELREELGPQAAVLRDRSGGKARPMTLEEFRHRIESGYQPDLFEIGGCGCFVDVDAEGAA